MSRAVRAVRLGLARPGGRGPQRGRGADHRQRLRRAHSRGGPRRRGEPLPGLPRRRELLAPGPRRGPDHLQVQAALRRDRGAGPGRRVHDRRHVRQVLAGGAPGAGRLGGDRGTRWGVGRAPGGERRGRPGRPRGRARGAARRGTRWRRRRPRGGRGASLGGREPARRSRSASFGGRGPARRRGGQGDRGPGRHRGSQGRGRRRAAGGLGPGRGRRGSRRGAQRRGRGGSRGPRRRGRGGDRGPRRRANEALEATRAALEGLRARVAPPEPSASPDDLEQLLAALAVPDLVRSQVDAAVARRVLEETDRAVRRRHAQVATARRLGLAGMDPAALAELLEAARSP